MKKAIFGVFLLLVSGLLMAETPDGLRFENTDSLKFPYKPALAGVMSLLVPGGGQVYTGHYLKAGTFLALEAITGSVSYFWHKTSKVRSQEAYDLLREARTGAGIDSARVFEKYLQMEHSVLEARYKSYNMASWMIGGYLFNILDALDASGVLKDGGYRDPSVAAWLAAIPGLGLGQIYNGSLSKAGLVAMVQVSLGFVAYNYHRLMREAEKAMVFDKSKYSDNELEIKSVINDEFNRSWESKRSSAFRNRNTYLWYSIFFYFYGIFDAVVDAHLHDYDEKMKIWPDLVPQGDGAQLLLNMKF